MAKREEVLAPLLAALRDLVAWFEAARVSGLVIGGVAASLLGRPRVTRDMDAVVLLEEREWGTFLSRGSGHGFTPRISNPLPFVRKARVFLVRHKSSGIDEAGWGNPWDCARKPPAEDMSEDRSAPGGIDKPV